jgi:hypothetical protein
MVPASSVPKSFTVKCESALEEMQPRYGVTLDGVKRVKSSCRDRGRHLTATSKVGAHPRISACSTVVITGSGSSHGSGEKTEENVKNL